MLDVRIRGGQVVDGTGAPRRSQTVAVRDGRIVPDDPNEGARRTIDVDGLAIAPGFVDAHTHVDPQVFWDPTLQPSTQHGVTSLIAGNCSFSIVPARAEERDYVLNLFARTEGMPIELLESTVEFDWRTPAEMMARMRSVGLGANVGLLVGHSVLRRTVMGERAVGEVAGDDDLTAMKALLGDALGAGFMGLSMSRTPTHFDHHFDPIPARWATDEEIFALCSVVGDHPGTTLEASFRGSPFTDDETELVTRMSRAANRPLNINAFSVSHGDTDLYVNRLATMDHARQRGACVKWLNYPQPFMTVISFQTGNMLDGLPGWGELFSLTEREIVDQLRDPEARRKLQAGAESLTEADGGFEMYKHWTDYRVAETTSPANDGLSGRTIGEIAAQRNAPAFDTFLDIALEDGLATTFYGPFGRDDDETWRLRAELCADPRFIIGGSDSGAHLNMMCGSSMTTLMLANFRDRGLMSLEGIVHQLTGRLAQYFGLRDRGRIAVGRHADLVIFDAATIGPGSPTIRRDLPGDHMRVWCDAVGIEHVFVNGAEVLADGQATGEQPGIVLRAGREVDTVDNATANAL